MSNGFEIKSVSAIEIFDSRGNPTVEATVTLNSGIMASCIAPSGASTGSMEACELRDGGERMRGKGVLKAVENVNTKINAALQGKNCLKQRDIDDILINLDGTKNKTKLGANAILPVSIATAKAASMHNNSPMYKYIGGVNSNTLPAPMINVINGGAHADNKLDIQEFMIMPISGDSFSSAFNMATDVFFALKSILKQRGLSTNVGDEGGFAPDIGSPELALDLIMMAIEKCGYKPAKDFVLALDVAANELTVNDRNDYYEFVGLGEKFDSSKLCEYYRSLILNYPIFSIEDPVAENDKEGFKEITEVIGNVVQLVGDDYFVTNPALISQGIKDGVGNAVLIKPNQIGTLTETLDAIAVAKRGGYQTIISHRSGESEDVSISQISVGANVSQIKTGSTSRTDRVAKYNELIRIENMLGDDANYAGRLIGDVFKKFRLESGGISW